MNERLNALREQLKALRLDALLVTFLPHVRYLTNFSGSNGLVLMTPRGQWFLSDGRYRNQAAEEVQGFRRIIAKGSLFEELKRRAIVPPKGRLGIDARNLLLSEFQGLKKLFPGLRMIPAHSPVESLAAVKDDTEIRLIKKAIAITERVFVKLLDLVKPGVSELEVAAEIAYLHRSLGADADAFEPIVASGVRGSLPHARATQKKIRRGELVTLDLGCRVDGYHSDLTRTVAVGRVNAAQRRVYTIVREAQQRALEAVTEGMEAKTLDAVARKHIARKGYGRMFTHSLGHGLGLQVHELPRISALSGDILRAGNVITIEPGVYVPGLGGVRIEDDVVVRRSGCEILTTVPRELVIL